MKQEKDILKQFTARSYFIAMLVLGSFFVIIIKLIEIQLLDVYSYRNLAESQAIRKQIIKPKRGIIFDRNNRVLANSSIVYDIGARYEDITNPEETFKTLARYMNKKPVDYTSVFKSKKKYYILEKNIPMSTGSELIKENLHGLRFEEKILRKYPYEDAAGQILGYIGWDGQGVTGIEKLYDETLRGVEGWEQVQYDRKGRRVSAAGINGIPKKDGGDVYLTIDIDYQNILEEEIRKAVKNHGAAHGMGVLINPNTGHILGMATWPNFNPNQASSFSPEQKRNRVIADSFEPGSVYKIVAAAAALESGSMNRKSIVNCEGGEWEFLGRIIHDTKEHHWLSLEDVIVYSSNIGIGKIAENEGKEILYGMSKNLGFGEQTGLFPSMEVGGTLKPTSEWGRISASQIAMGHNVTANLLQLVMAYSAIANNGLLLQPVIVRSAYTPDHKQIVQETVEVIRRAMSESTASTMREILENTVIRGTGNSAYIKGYQVAGKTGTAQKVINGIYSDSDYMSSFIGFFPANKPVLVCGITLDSPRYNEHWGSTCAAPAVKNVFTRIINTTDFNNLYDWVQPDEKTLAGTSEKSSTLSQQYSASLGLQGVSVPEKTEQLPKTESIVQRQSDSPLNIYVHMPDVRRMSVKNAAHILSKLSLNYDIKGSEKIIIDQDPLPGEPLTQGSICLLITGKKR